MGLIRQNLRLSTPTAPPLLTANFFYPLLLPTSRTQDLSLDLIHENSSGMVTIESLTALLLTLHF
jgi:hypothetical protein